MRPIRTSETNRLYVGPPGIGDLPLLEGIGPGGGPAFRSTWDLEPEERAAIAAGANVALTVLGAQVPVTLELSPLEGIGDDAPEFRARLRFLRKALEEDTETPPEGRSAGGGPGAPLEGQERS